MNKIGPTGPLELTVIVTTHNRADLINETLTALANQTWTDGTWNILIIDNDSTDNTPAILKTWPNKMPVPTTIITATQRHSAAYARNTAAANTNATNIAFIDDDDLIAPGWVTAIGTALRTHQLVGSRMDYHRLNDPAIAPAHTFQTERLGRHFGVEVVDSAGSGCRRELWNTLGGSDETLWFAEDADFSLRVARLGGVSPHFCAGAVCHARLPVSPLAAFRRGRHRGHAEVQIYRAHGEAFGVSPDGVPVVIARILRLVVQSPRALIPRHRLVWAEGVGRRLGRLRGSIAERCWYP